MSRSLHACRGLTCSQHLAALRRLAAEVAHEMSSPLTSVLTFAHMMLEDAQAGSQMRQDAQAVVDAAIRCRVVVQALADFARLGQPRKRLSNLCDVLRAALDQMRPRALRHHVRIVEELDAPLPAVEIDPDQVQEAAANIILNAIEAMPDGGTLAVCARAVEADGRLWVEFQVADTGRGIPAENLDRIFDPFFTTKPAGQGMGLGLAISHGIVTHHGGDIQVAGEQGRGTVVTVRLALAGKD
jgi:signal transduction histidine kinase